MSRDKHRSALALGSGITLLGVIRVLSQAGIDVLAPPDIDGPASRSRWFRAAPPQFAGLRPVALISALETLESPTVLMPCSDEWVKAIAELPESVRRTHPASVAPADAVRVLVDKNRFRDTLARLGLPHPTTINLTSERDLETVPDSALSSSFLKPVSSQKFFAQFGVKAFRVAGRAEARERLATCIGAGLEMILQEYIPGPPTNHHFIDGFVDRGGVVRARFARRRLRMSPPDFGNSTLMESIPVAETQTAAGTLDALFADLRYRGVFSAEFKRDARNGEFNLIEVNARPWWYVEFAARCGVNVCEMAVRDALGEQVQTVSKYAVGRRCVYPYYDFDAIREEAAVGHLSLLAGAKSWLGAYQPIFRWSDPLPALGEVTRMFQRRLGRRA